MEIVVNSPKFGRHIVCIDEADYNRIAKMSICVVKRKYKFYAQVSANGEYYLLHRFLLNPGSGLLVDHKDGNGLNCQRNNMRVADYYENGRNRSATKRSKSGYKGVFWHKGANKWRAQINVNRKSIHGGFFDNKEDAARMYDEMAAKHHKDFIKLNIS